MFRATKIAVAAVVALAMAVLPVVLDQCAGSCEAHRDTVASTPACHHTTSTGTHIAHVPNPCAHDHNGTVITTANNPAPTGTSTGWAVQLAAPKSEAEAKSAVARLNAKYASALNGSAIGVHKAVVNGDTIYRLRVVGLSKADAAALCARLKGDGGDCFIAK